MKSVLLTLPIGSGFPVHSFIFMLVVALAVALALIVTSAEKMGVPKNSALDTALISALTGILGARAFFLLFENAPIDKAKHPFLDFGEGELSAWGGILAATLTILIYTKMKNIPFKQTLDLFSLPTAAGFLLGRVGCLLASCCWGKITPPTLSSLGMLFPEESNVMTKQWIDFVEHPPKWESLMTALGYPADQSPSLPVYPTQIIFIALMLAITITLLKKGYGKKYNAGQTPAPGTLFLTFCTLFAASHLAVGFLRDDLPPLFKSGTLSHIQLGQIIAIIALASVATIRKTTRKSAQYP